MQLLVQRLFRKLNTQRYIIVLGALLIIIPASISLAGDSESNELQEQQQKLQEILGEIGVAQEQRAEQKALLEKLSKKMQCNWDLIQDYDACGKKYNEQKKEQLNCVQQAKERARECLSRITN